MDPFALIGVAANLTRVIIHLSYTYKLQQTHVGMLVDRIISLEKPLETLERTGQNGGNNISEAALRKLISTLEEVQAIIEEHQKMDRTSKTKRFFFGDAKMDDLRLIKEKLDASLMDLQLAITVEESGNSEKRVALTARATVDILLSSVQQRATETILKCVQCGSEYRQSENAVGSCKYHTSFPIVQNWKYNVSCCNKTFQNEGDVHNANCDGCVRGVHCDFHHTQYPYSAYFLWMRSQMNTNVKETWLKVSDFDFEDHIDKHASFGLSNDGLLFVSLGKGYFPLFLQYFDPNNMPQLSGPVLGNMMTIAMRGSDIQPGECEKEQADGKKWVVDALWTLNSQNEIQGIRLSASSLSSKFPVIKELYFSLNPLTKGATRILSFSAAPHKGYFTDPLPPCESHYEPFPDKIFQSSPMEPNYETIVKGNMNVRLKKSAKCVANPEFSGQAHDTFVLEFFVMNLSQGATLGSSTDERMVVLGMLKDGKMNVEEAIKLLSTLDSSPHQHGSLTFIDIRARFFFENRWVESSRVKATLKKDEKMIPALPFELTPRGAQKVVVEAVLDVPEKRKSSNWFNRAYAARLEPVGVEIIFEEMSGSTCSIMTQYSNPPAVFKVTNIESALFSVVVDNSSTWERNYILINKPRDPEKSFDLHINGSQTIGVGYHELMRWGYEAAKANTPVYNIDYFNGPTGFKVEGLVDLLQAVVVGFKIRIAAGDNYNEGIWMIPDDLFLASRKLAIGEEVERALWNTTPEKPTQPSPKPPAPRPRMGTNREPPTSPLPPTPTTSNTNTNTNTNKPPTAQPPSSQPPSSQPPTLPRTGSANTVTKTTPAPPPRGTTFTNGTNGTNGSAPIAKSGSNNNITPPPTTNSPSLAPTSAPLAKSGSNNNITPPTTNSPSLAPTPIPNRSPSPQPTTIPPVSPPITSLLAALEPPPLSPPSPTPSTPPPAFDKLAYRCIQCSFALKKDECIKCRKMVPQNPPAPQGQFCQMCRVNFKQKCANCSGVLVANKTTNAILCNQCCFNGGQNKCIKCSKPVN